jgi:hypothetical protein
VESGSRGPLESVEKSEAWSFDTGRHIGMLEGVCIERPNALASIWWRWQSKHQLRPQSVRGCLKGIGTMTPRRTGNAETIEILPENGGAGTWC